ncbi:MAG: SDR family oxidoreductase [Thermoanaerobaculia bacterium]|jgi:NAD(P)H dehydrogenase (quinone)
MIVVTGASGKLGHHVVEALLENVPANEVAVAVRTVAKAADLATLGVEVRQLDYDKPESAATALAGADKVLLISSSEVGKRFPQHRTVVDAAKKAGVKLLAYTSLVNVGRARMTLAAEHLATEEYIRASGVPFVFLRNGWYIENYSENLAPALAHGALVGSAGHGRVSAATRSDYAAAAAAVLTGSGHERKVYELAGDTALTLSELASAIATASGKPIVYNDLPAPELARVLIGAGLPQSFADILADADLGLGRGELENGSGDLRRLIGRPTTTIVEVLAKHFGTEDAR